VSPAARTRTGVSPLRRVWPLALLLLVCALVRLRHAPTQVRPLRTLEPPSWEFPFGLGDAGTDVIGIASEGILRAASLAVAVATFGLIVGVTLGALAAYCGGIIDRSVSRACDLVQAFPGFLLAMAVLAGAKSPTRAHLFLVFALTAWAPFCRLALAEGRIAQSLAYVEAARAFGASSTYVLRRHVIPHLMPTAWMQFGSTCSAVILGEAALSFVGIGPSGVSLGALLDQGVFFMLLSPHVLCVGALGVLLTSQSLLYLSRTNKGSR
jgi:peptide/nickel transport system permease protein